MEFIGQQQNVIINKLKGGVKFGLYDGGKSCYFEDGTRVDYKVLWEAIRSIHNLEKAHNKTIFELCPDTYLGIFPYKFRKVNRWKKNVFSALFGHFSSN